MIVVDKQSRIPVYEQIKNQIITLIRLGVYPANSKLPSIRSISADISVNVNTVKKAFAELEMNGVIYSVPGTGCFVSEQALGDEKLFEKTKREISDSVQTAKSLGIPIEDLLELIKFVYKEESL
ncbi:MAG: GntR family transcriptional regulator [Clostridia bacterium]|nr:GntR family transcriptional regulator [Clostridia bacterium]MBQ4604538.1 GntR family transcriptional regulator [Clostridia bacterium]